MEQVLAVPFNFNWQAKKYFKYISQRTGVNCKMVAIPVLSGVAYAERFMNSGKLLIFDIDNIYTQLAIIEKRNDLINCYEVKSVSGFYTEQMPLNTDMPAHEITNWMINICNLDNFLEDNFDKVLLCGPLSEQSAFLLMVLKKAFGTKFDTWTDSVPASTVGAQIIQNSLTGFFLDNKSITIKNEIIVPKLAIKIEDSGQIQTIIKNNTMLPLETTVEIDLTECNRDIYKPITIHLLEFFGEDFHCISSIPLDFIPTSLTLTIKIDSSMNMSLIFQDKQQNTEKTTKVCNL